MKIWNVSTLRTVPGTVLLYAKILIQYPLLFKTVLYTTGTALLPGTVQYNQGAGAMERQSRKSNAKKGGSGKIII